jgi:1-acyl-sn-glycerol-3-phosphate acyltransferase
MYLDGRAGPFKKGAVRIARSAAMERGWPVFIVPVRISYGRYPGPWIRRYRAPLSYFLMLLWSLSMRPGATVIVGKPLSSDELPADDAEATELLKQRLFELTVPGR